MINSKIVEEIAARWRVHTPNLLSEVLENPGTEMLEKPLNIFGKLLYKVAARAIELDDPELNKLMLQLTLYSVADPGSPDYDKGVVDRILRD